MEIRALATTDAIEAAHAFFEEVVVRHGSPQRLITDRGTNFTATLFSELCKILGVKKIHTVAYHPEGNGSIERANGTIIRMISVFIEEDTTKWYDLMQVILFSYRTSIHRSIQMTPFEALYGRSAVLPLEIENYVKPKLKQDVDVSVQDFIEKIHLIQERARLNNQRAQSKSKICYDKKAKEIIFRPGDMVVLKTRDYIKKRLAKFKDKYFGPFEVLAQLSSVNYRVRNEDSNKEMIVHVNRMKALPEGNAAGTDQNMVDELFEQSDSDDLSR